MPPARGRNVAPDQQVWPPATRRNTMGATQPIPAVQENIPTPAGVNGPAAGAQGAGAAVGMDGQAAAVGIDGQAPAEATPGDGAGQDTPPDAPRPTARTRRGRMALVAVGAVVVSLLTTAAQAFDGYQFYEDVITLGLYPKQMTVPAGGSHEVYGIEWKAAVAAAEPPEDNRHGPEVTWLAIDIRQKVLVEDSVTMIYKPDMLKLTDRAGRTWVVELIPDDDRPTDRLVVGKEYRIQGMAVVPTAVKDEVELSFRPSSGRSDTPVEDLFKKDSEAVRIDNLVELTFSRR